MPRRPYVFRKKINFLLAGALDFLGDRFFKKKTDGPARGARIKKILLIRLDHLGDVLYATGAPKAVKEAHPSAELHFLVSSYAAPLFQNNPHIDRLHIYDAAWFSRRRFKRSGESASFAGLIRTFQKLRMDLGIGLRGDLRENFLLWACRIPHRLSYGITGGGFFLTHEVPYQTDAHASEHTKNLLRAAAIETRKLAPELYFTEEEIAAAKNRWPSLGLDPTRRYIGFQLEPGYPSKEWPPERVAEFFELHRRRLAEFPLVLTGSSPKKLERLLRALPSSGKGGLEKFSVINLVGKTSIRELMLIQRELAAFVGYDSGPSYIASTLKVPTVFLYSGTNIFERWRPLSESAHVLKHSVPCSPCSLERCPVEGHPCMSGIEPARVVGALQELLG